MAKDSKSKSRQSGAATSVGALSREAKKPPMTDAERHRRFVDMAHEVQASERAEDFDKAFEAVTTKPIP